MPMRTQAQIAAGTGTQEAQRVDARHPLAFVPPPQGPGNPNGVMGDVGLWSRTMSGLGYGPEAGAAFDQWNRPAPAGGFTARDIYGSSPAQLYAELFGTTTPQMRVSGAVAPPPGSNANANGGGANNAPAAPLATPQQAGENNSVMPGWSGGSPEVGVDTSLSGLPIPDRTATDPLNVTLKSATAGPVDLAKMAGTPSEGPVTETKNATSGGVTISIGGQTYNVTRQPNAQVWATYTKAQKIKWAQDHAASGGDTTQPVPAPPPQGNNFGVDTGPYKPPRYMLTGIPSFAADAPVNDVFNAVQDPYARTIVLALGNLVNGDAKHPSLASLAATGATGHQPATYTHIRQLGEKMEAYLNSIGIDWHPVTQLGQSAGGGGGGAGGDGSGGGTTGGGGSGDPNAPGGAGGGFGGGEAAYPGTNTDLQDINSYLSAAEARVNALMGGGSRDPKYRPFMTEMIYAVAEQMRRDAMQQQGINVYANATGAFQSDPLRTKERDIMSGILEHPDNTPWDTVEANLGADLHKGAESAAQTYGASAARRLGSAGAQPGVYADLERTANENLARALGDLAVRKAATERDAEYRALSGADALRLSTTGADVQNAQTLANLLYGAASPGANPMAGAGSAWVDSNTFNKANNQSAPGLGLTDLLGGFSTLFKPGSSGTTGSSAAGGFLGLLTQLFGGGGSAAGASGLADAATAGAGLGALAGI